MDDQLDFDAKERRKRKTTEDDAPSTYGALLPVQPGDVTLNANHLALLARHLSDKH